VSLKFLLVAMAHAANPKSEIRNPKLKWRRGQESNLPWPERSRTNNGFEDREGHQAPFTLLKAERLLCLFDRADDGVEIRPFAGLQLGVKEIAICENFESAALGWNERQRTDPFPEFENFSRQTDGLGRVVSNDAVFDGNFSFHGSPSWNQRTKGEEGGQG
jgi:hypothetical protein